jgi:hypothetical protein
MNTPNTQAQFEQNQTTTPTLEDLQRPFAGICFAYGSIFGDVLSNSDLLYRLQWLIDDAEKITGIAMTLRNNIFEGASKQAVKS